MTPWPHIPGPWDAPAGDNVVGTLTRADFNRGDDTVTHLVAPPPVKDMRGKKPPTRVRTVVDNRSNPGLDVVDRSWLWGHYKWREVRAPKFNTGDVSGDGRAWVFTDDACYEYQGLAVSKFPELFLVANKHTRTNVGRYPWGEEWTPLAPGELGTTTGGLPDVALYQMERGKPINHALHIGLPADLLRLPDSFVKQFIVGPDREPIDGNEYHPGYVSPCSFTDIHPHGHDLYDPHRGRQDGTLGIPMGARLRLTFGGANAAAERVGAEQLSGPVIDIINALHTHGGYVTITTQPTVRPEGRMSIGVANDYLTVAERTALQAALQDAEWEVVVDD